MGERVGQQLGNYRLTRLLGQGGFAEVYLGEHLYLKTQVAVKVLSGSLIRSDVEAFLHEARSIAALKHPHILRVLDFDIEGSASTPFLILEYAAHGTLRDRHPRGSRVPLPLVVSYVQDMAEALQYAHDARLVHRDVKPENMLLDERDTLLLSDFGIAAVAHSTATMKTLTSAGTPHYMSPEQFRGKPVPASDQYSLAVVVYEWLCGRPPYSADTPLALGFQHHSAPIPSLRKYHAALPPRVESVVQRALAKKAGQRFATIMEFANALEQGSQPPKASSSQASSSSTAGKSGTKSHQTGQPKNTAQPPKEPPVRPASAPRGEKSTSQQKQKAEKAHMASTTLPTSEEATVDVASTARRTTPIPSQFTPMSAPPLVTPVSAQTPLRKQASKKPVKRSRFFVLVSIGLLTVVLGSILFGGYQLHTHMTISDATATVSALKYPSYLPGHGHLLRYDSLQSGLFDPLSHYWSTKGSACSLGKDGYHIIANALPDSNAQSTTPQNGNPVSCQPDTNVGDFALLTQMTLIRGDCAGVNVAYIFSQTDDGILRNNYYRYYAMELCENGSYVVADDVEGSNSEDNSSLASALPTTYTSSTEEATSGSMGMKLRVNQTYTVAVVRIGSNISLFINGKSIAHEDLSAIIDSHLSNDGVLDAMDLSAYSKGNPTEVVFRQAAVWSLS